MEETTAIQPLSIRRDMRNIQAERYKCSSSQPMKKRMDALTKHRIKRESFIHNNNKLKKTYNNNNNNIKTVQCTYSSVSMSFEHTNRSLTIRPAIFTVTRDQDDTTKKLLTLTYIDDLYPHATWIHVYTDGSRTDNSTLWFCWRFDYTANSRHWKHLQLLENTAQTAMPKWKPQNLELKPW